MSVDRAEPSRDVDIVTRSWRETERCRAAWYEDMPRNGTIVPYGPGEEQAEKAALAFRRREQQRACDAWIDGECCGHTHQVEPSGRCPIACGGCYADPLGLAMAEKDWREIESYGVLLSPWTRARELARFQHELEVMNDD